MKKWLILLILILAGATTALAASLYNARRDASIAQANHRALQDTIRRYQTDSTEAVSLMAIQADINTDSLAKLGDALAAAIEDRNIQVTMLSDLRVAFDAVRLELESTDVVVEEPEDCPDCEPEEITRVGTFDVEGPPIEGSLVVRVPWGLEETWDLTTDLRITPFKVKWDAGCDELRNAVFNASVPDWVDLTLERGTVDPTMCHGQKVSLFDFSWGKTAWFGGGFLVGGDHRDPDVPDRPLTS